MNNGVRLSVRQYLNINLAYNKWINPNPDAADKANLCFISKWSNFVWWLCDQESHCDNVWAQLIVGGGDDPKNKEKTKREISFTALTIYFMEKHYIAN